ncbi:MAG: hypothetical protein KA736_10345 [Crocinitomicaceae bacterium]|nr:hypothetical protein [Crocinitomicaceae bacterium]MBP6031806.1 hypothetical protein [Crocinitomicaceae bacterium]
MKRITKEHILGFLIGVLTPIVFLPLIVFILAQSRHSEFSYLWSQVNDSVEYLSRYLSLGLIPNLLWFYLFLNKEKYAYTRGIIFGMLIYAPFMVYVNLIK